MLYQTTRTKNDTYTAARALSEDRSPDGGFFVPLKFPQFDKQQIRKLGEKSFSQNVADVVNLFFSTQLDGWAVEFAIGRYPVKLHSIGSREMVAETWHNPVWKFDRLARGIEKAIRQSDEVCTVPADWLMIASRIAVLFGMFGEMIRDGKLNVNDPIDVAVPSGNFSAPMAVWYAKHMGLPISTVLCCCNDNNGTWKLLHKGEIRTDAPPVTTATPLCDQMAPAGLERLVFANLGVRMASEFADVCKNGGTFYLEPEQQKKLRDCMYVPVTGQRRLESAVKSLYNSCGYAADAYTALCYSGMLDYRSVTGEGRPVLILSEESPTYTLPYLSQCMGISPQELKKRINNQR